MWIKIQDTLDDQLTQITLYTYCLLLPSSPRYTWNPLVSFPFTCSNLFFQWNNLKENSDQHVPICSRLEEKNALKGKARSVCRKEEKFNLQPCENNQEPSRILLPVDLTDPVSTVTITKIISKNQSDYASFKMCHYFQDSPCFLSMTKYLNMTHKFLYLQPHIIPFIICLHIFCFNLIIFT